MSIFLRSLSVKSENQLAQIHYRNRDSRRGIVMYVCGGRKQPGRTFGFGVDPRNGIKVRDPAQWEKDLTLPDLPPPEKQRVRS
jgi:hypothetical protein